LSHKYSTQWKKGEKIGRAGEGEEKERESE
jgi:hypothetical protein